MLPINPELMKKLPTAFTEIKSNAFYFDLAIIKINSYVAIML